MDKSQVAESRWNDIRMVGGKMKDFEVLQKIKENGVVSIIRGTKPDQIKKTVQALYEGGIRIIEVTYNTPGAPEIIKELTEEFADRMIIGAGTVLDPESARSAILSGAQFILSPSLNKDVIQMCQRYSVLTVPGVMTPTEAVQAWQAGAHIVKVFPAVNLGPTFIKQLLGPLNQIEIMVVGGMNADNFAEYLKNGACSVGIGSDLVNAKEVDDEKYDEIEEKAKCYVNIFQEYKTNGGVK